MDFFSNAFNIVGLYIIFRLTEVLLRATPTVGTISPDGFTRKMEYVRKTLAVIWIILCLVIMFKFNALTGFWAREPPING